MHGHAGVLCSDLSGVSVTVTLLIDSPAAAGVRMLKEPHRARLCMNYCRGIVADDKECS